MATEQAARINDARKTLIQVIDVGLSTRAASFRDLQKAGADILKGVPLTQLIARAGVPDVDALMYPEKPLWGKHRIYAEILRDMRDQCITVDEEAIRLAQERGIQNARTYLAMHDVDVYVATSMREPLNFTTNWAFVRRLFHEGDLADWRLRYFDPTQAFLPDRVQKGLTECLMIKRAELTVYNAQEDDTFGKDAEAGVTLAQRKPVVVFVARLFEGVDGLASLYATIDAGARLERDELLNLLLEKGFVREADAGLLRGPERTKADIINQVLRARATEVLSGLGDEKIAFELMSQGYNPDPGESTIASFAVQRILRLERRALTFRNIHPLSLQTSPIDGVSRGVIVTRSVEETSRVVRAILLGTLEYEIVEDEANWLLVDKITRSPVRVVTKDPVLTAAFWSEDWRVPDGGV